MSRREVDKDGTVRYYNSNDEVHREDGPALECADGSKSWYINGRFIRQNTTNHFAKLSRLSLCCFVTAELFLYDDFADSISEELNVNFHFNFKEFVINIE